MVRRLTVNEFVSAVGGSIPSRPNTVPGTPLGAGREYSIMVNALYS